MCAAASPARRDNGALEMISELKRQIESTAADAGASAASVAYYDYATETSWSYRGARWYHAASTIKVAVLVGLFAAVEAGRFRLDDRLHVRNRFFSAHDGSAYSIGSARDSNSDVHTAVGKLMRIRALAEHMIATSSNLATNLLLDLVGAGETRSALKELGISGVDLVRGVEDDAAYEAGLNNRVTAEGLTHLFRLIEDRQTFSKGAAEAMLDILHKQEFRSGIPAGIPESVRNETQFAHKTGDISTVTHDAGLVYLPDRPPYVVAILTEWAPDASNRRETVARISEAVYSFVTSQEAHAS